MPKQTPSGTVKGGASGKVGSAYQPPSDKPASNSGTGPPKASKK